MYHLIENDIIELYEKDKNIEKVVQTLSVEKDLYIQIPFAINLAVEKGLTPLVEVLLPYASKSRIFLFNCVRSSSWNKQWETMNFLLDKCVEDFPNHSLPVDILLPIISELNITMFDKVVSLVSPKHLSQNEIRHCCSVAEACVSFEFLEGLKTLSKIMVDENNKECVINYQANDGYFLRLIVEIENKEVIDFVCDQAVFTGSCLSSIMSGTEREPTPETMLYLVKKIATHPKQNISALEDLFPEVINYPGYFSVAQEIAKHIKTLSNTAAKEKLFDAMCEMGSLEMYKIYEKDFSNISIDVNVLARVAKSGQKDFFTYLLYKAPVSEKLTETVFKNAVYSKNIELVEFLCRHKDFALPSAKQEAFLEAIKLGSLDIVKKLLPYVNVYAENSDALYEAVLNKQNAIFDMLLPLSNPKARQSDMLVDALRDKNFYIIDKLMPLMCLQDDDGAAFKMASKMGLLEYVKQMKEHVPLSIGDYFAVVEASEHRKKDVLLYFMEMEEFKENFDTISQQVYDHSRSGYDFFNDCWAEVQCKNIEKQLLNDHDDVIQGDAPKKKRRM